MGRNGLGMKSIHGDTCFKFSRSTVYMVYSFSIAVITESHKYSDLKHLVTYSFIVLDI